jgi:hypothetical protein
MANTQTTYVDHFNDGEYPVVFKRIDPADVMIDPFKTYKTFTITSGSSTSSLLPLQGVYYNTNTTNWGNAFRITTGSGWYVPAGVTNTTPARNIDRSFQPVTYFSINHLFYKRKSNPMQQFGPTDLTRTKKALFQTASIFSIPIRRIGEGIKPGSFYISASSFTLASDTYSNIYDVAFNTSSIITNNMFYEGFNEFFDTTRIPTTYATKNVTYVNGVTTSDGSQLSVGLAAKFNGNGYISTKIAGTYGNTNDYTVSFFISGSNTGSSDQLIISKANSATTANYPFRILLSGSNQVKFQVKSGTQTLTLTSSTAVTSWTHVACRKSGTTYVLSINGTTHASTTVSRGNFSNTENLSIGGYDTSSANLRGVLDEIRIYNKSVGDTGVSYLANRTENGTFLQTNVVGTVFTKQGIAVVSSPHYKYSNLINTFTTCSYKSTKTIHEFSVVAKLNAGDFNVSSNPSLREDGTPSFQGFVSGSAFSPYITTIGLYNGYGQLLAIGKLAQPIKKRDDVDMNFLIRIDLDKSVFVKGSM